MLNREVLEKIRQIKPRSIVYLFSGGKDSSLALLLTRDFVKELCNEIKCRVYILYIVLPGNTHPLNAYAAASVMEWHRKRYGFKPLYRCYSFVFQEGVAKWGLQTGEGRWCYTIFKDRVFREIERSLPQPQIHIDGMSPSDSKVRSEKIRSELELIERSGGLRYYSWHPLFSLSMSPEEKLELLKQHEEFRPIVKLYEEFGDSLNCVLCPYKDMDKLLKHRGIEDLSILYDFLRESLLSSRWRRKFSRLGSKTLAEYVVRA